MFLVEVRIYIRQSRTHPVFLIKAVYWTPPICLACHTFHYCNLWCRFYVGCILY